ncbi:MAG: TonB-dependent receptor [Bacteroidales bacterium]|nr:MAG: TonB-dependent receptor [Bacteroidales bacterium]
MGFLLHIVASGQTVTGKVTDESGESLPGVTVLIKGTQTGTTTDIDGNYALTLDDPSQDILVFSFVGMVTEEIQVNNQSSIDLVMKTANQYLDELVVIGYGSVRKRDLTGAVSSVSNSQIKDMPVLSTAQALTGRLAGVHIVTSEGSPDADIKIRVRGGGSITQDNSPLYIIDGFPAESMGDIPPSDIESIDVLKDASSTAIYGSRGANGVIIITTKSGKEGKTEINYNFYTGYKKLSSVLDVLDPYEYVLYQYERSSGSFLERRDFEDLFGTWEQLDSLYTGSSANNWQEEVFGRKAQTTYHNLSVTGGTAKSSYNLSLSNTNDTGIMLQSGYKRNNLNFKFSNQTTERLKLDFDVKLNDTKIEGAGTSDPGTSTNNRLKHTVIYRPVNGLSDFSDDPDLEFDDEEYYEVSRLIDPVTLVNDEYRLRDRTYINFNGGLTLKIIDQLEYRSELGYDNRQQRYERFDGVSTPNARKYGDKPIVRIEESSSGFLRFANLLAYDLKNFRNSHNINVLLGQELLDNNYKNVRAESRSFPEDITPSVAIGSMELGEDNQKPITFEGLNRLLSFFGRINYGFREKYLASFTLRADGSSKFGPENRWGFFPSGSIAWRISEESFMQNLEFISYLKTRISYGQAGNNRIDDFLWTTTYKVGSDKAFYLNEVPLTFLYPDPNNLANPSLKWETTITRNAGIDLGVFNSRINLTLELYKNTVKDLLIRSRIPSVSGYNTQMRNIGQTTNQGVEIVLDAYIIDKDDFKLSANFNISFNRGRVDDLGGLDYFTVSSGWISDTGDDYIVKIGEPVGLMYGFVTDGFYNTDDFTYDDVTGTYTLNPGVADNSGITFAGFGPGSVQFEDIGSPVDENGNPIDDGNLVTFDEDRTIIGNSNPKHTGGCNIMMNYKGLDLSVFLNWVYGNDIYNANKIEFTSGYRKYTNLVSDMNSDKRWTSIDESGAQVTDPVSLSEMNSDASIWTPQQGRYLFHSWAVEDGSFLRINNITLGYTLPEKWTGKVYVSRLRFYATVNNLYTFTNYTGYDPEVDTRRQTPLTPGVDYSAYPRSRSYLFGLNLTF